MDSWVKNLSAILFACACGGGAATTNVGLPPGMSSGESNAPLVYRFDSLDAREVSSSAFAGKPAVISFITTYDPISQMQVTYLVALDAPFANVAIVALQDATARELVLIYRDMMKVKFPVALGDDATTAGGGVLGDVHQVPTTIILDKDGRIAWHHAGLVTTSELSDQLKRASR